MTFNLLYCKISRYYMTFKKIIVSIQTGLLLDSNLAVAVSYQKALTLQFPVWLPVS